MVDEIIRALAGEERRHVLARLRSEHPAASVDSGELTVNGGEDERIRLHHSRLPMLADAGLITWDRERGVVGRGPAFDAALPFLDLIEEQGSESAACRNLPA